MDRLSRSQTVGLIALMFIILGIVGWTVISASVTPPSSGITLKQPGILPVSSPTSSGLPLTSGAMNSGEESAPHSVTTSAPPITGIPDQEKPAEIVVHVAGAVHKPGVYHLHPGARNEDALKAAGGSASDANTNAVNLAAHIEDGSQLYIPTHKEQQSGPATATSTAAVPQSGSISSVKKGSKSTSTASINKGGAKPSKLKNPSQGKINLNSASAEELQRVPGIGPAMADRLIQYRKDNNGFQTVEDLMQVSGIGEKKFAKMQPFFRVR